MSEENSMRLSSTLTRCPCCKYSFWVKEIDIKRGKLKEAFELIRIGALNIGGEEIHAIDRIRKR